MAVVGTAGTPSSLSVLSKRGPSSAPVDAAAVVTISTAVCAALAATDLITLLARGRASIPSSCYIEER